MFTVPAPSLGISGWVSLGVLWLLVFGVVVLLWRKIIGPEVRAWTIRHPARPQVAIPHRAHKVYDDPSPKPRPWQEEAWGYFHSQ